VSRSKERTIKLKMAVGALVMAGALSLGVVQANAATPMETDSRHWANSVECGTEQDAR
jgi:hypothetical protein